MYKIVPVQPVISWSKSVLKFIYSPQGIVVVAAVVEVVDVKPVSYSSETVGQFVRTFILVTVPPGISEEMVNLEPTEIELGVASYV